MRGNIQPMIPNKKPAPKSTPRTDERLAKRVAEIVPCSRREAEQYIEGGWVSVNGKVVEEPMFRVSDHKVEIDRDASLMELVDVTLLLHKPPGYDTLAEPGEANKKVKPAQQLLSAATHAKDDVGGSRLLKRHFANLTAAVELETGASGLVVFTQDWRVLRKLEEDAGVIEQEIIVEVAGEVEQSILNRLNHGLASDGHPLPPVKVSLNSTSDASSKLRFAIKGSHPGLIAYLCERVGMEILSMKRIRVGRVSLSQLPLGQWRYLHAHERF
ncbi:MAG: RNA pseudouridine synthase [Pseudomonadota bacterium]